MDAAERIEAGLPIPAHLEAIIMDGAALGGARPKASVRDKNGVLWMAKFSSRKDSFDIPAIECAALRLAAAAGLTVPPGVCACWALAGSCSSVVSTATGPSQGSRWPTMLT